MNFIPPRIICFSGGGIRAVAFVGTLEVLQKYKLLNHVNEYIGVSAGALIAFLLAIGYTIQELKTLVCGFDFSLVRNLDPENTLEFFERFGLDDGANLTKLCESVMKQKNLPASLTFEELAKLSPTLPRFRCYASDLNTCQSREFSLTATPTVKIIDALKASMSLSFYFVPIEDPVTGHCLTDGGALNNYPMVFLTEEEQRRALGIMFSGEHAENKKIESLFDFITQLYACVYMPRIRQITQTLAERTILLPHGDYPSWNFEATKEERIMLIQGAVEATEIFLGKGNPSRPFRRYSVC